MLTRCACTALQHRNSAALDMIDMIAWSSLHLCG